MKFTLDNDMICAKYPLYNETERERETKILDHYLACRALGDESVFEH